MKKISVAHIVGCIDARSGGPTQALRELCRHLNHSEVNSEVFSFHYPYDDRDQVWKDMTVHHLSYNPCSRALAGWNPAASKELLKIVSEQKIEVIHNLGLWLFPNFYARQTAQQLKKPLITSVRGMLEPWALNQNRIKKKIIWQLYEKQNLNAVDVFHATSHQEAHSIRKLGFKQPIAMIPNGVSPIHESAEKAPQNFFPEMQNKKILLFLSRIDPKKGLESLFQIWAQLTLEYPDWMLVIAGDGDANYVAQLKKQSDRINKRKTIVWAGFVEGEKKQALWQRANLFILPSFSENFGNVIAESLSYGVPVITTQATPWSELNFEQCGWWVNSDKKILQETLSKAMSLQSAKLKEMGQKGRQLIEKKYRWQETAGQMAATYRWMLKLGSKPTCIFEG